MIPLVPATGHAVAHSAGWTVSALLRDILDAWIAHHQRLADCGVNADF